MKIGCFEYRPQRRDCACGKKEVGGGIRQERIGPSLWRVHDTFECYELRGGYKKVLARKGAK